MLAAAPMCSVSRKHYSRRHKALCIAPRSASFCPAPAASQPRRSSAPDGTYKRTPHPGCPVSKLPYSTQRAKSIPPNAVVRDRFLEAASRGCAGHAQRLDPAPGLNPAGCSCHLSRPRGHAREAPASGPSRREDEVSAKPDGLTRHLVVSERRLTTMAHWRLRSARTWLWRRAEQRSVPTARRASVLGARRCMHCLAARVSV